MGKKLAVYDLAGSEGTVVLEIADGAKLALEPRVICAENRLWWSMQLLDEAGMGWISETVDGEYVIAPVK